MHLWLLILLIVSASTCDTEVQTLTCSFIVKGESSDCTNFTFQSCIYRKCVKGIDSDCSNFDIISSTNWSYCIKNCCTVSPNAPQTYQTLQNCQTLNSQQLPMMIGITTASVLLFGFSIICFCCCMAFSRRKTICDCICCYPRQNIIKKQANDWRKQREREKQVYSDIFLHIEHINKGPNRPVKKRWYRCEWRVARKIEDMPCAICKTKSPTFRLPCGHIFHRSCLFRQLRKYYECPQCHTKQIDQLRIFCQACHWSTRSANLKLDQKLDVQPQLCRQCYN